MVDSGVTMIFAGWCRVCSRTIAMLERLDRLDRLRMVPCQSIDGVERLGITRAQCDGSVWVIDASGKATRGGEAAMHILGTALEQAWLMRMGGMPGIRQMIDTGYRFVARNRRRLPGTTPWCAQHPERCHVDDPVPTGIGREGRA